MPTSGFADRQMRRAEAAGQLERIDNEFPGLVDEYLEFRTPSTSKLTEANIVGESRFGIHEDPRLKGLTVHDAAARVLREAGRPMKTAEISEMLKSRGYGVDIASLRNSVFTALNRKDDMFEKVAPGEWALKEAASE